MRPTPGPVIQGGLTPSPDVVAAIVAAAEVCWPRPVARQQDGDRRTGPEYVWRMSGRWWNKPVAMRRDRPWTEW